jgi:hypothetical protein
VHPAISKKSAGDCGNFALHILVHSFPHAHALVQHSENTPLLWSQSHEYQAKNPAKAQSFQI